MRSKKGLKLTKKYSLNFSLPKRTKKKIKFIVIHYTGMKNESDAINKLCNFGSKVSCHYFVKNNGNLLNLVPDTYESWHAGKSNWKKYKLLNKYSIGIEIQNPGHYHGYKKFSKNQMITLIRLLKNLTKKYNINVKNILGHSDISPNRKKDPGENFPWKLLAKKKLSYFHNLNENKIKNYRNLKISQKDENFFLKNLYKIGYCKIKKVISSKNKRYLTNAFQRRFRQGLINGKIDKESLLISKDLLNT